MGHWPISLPRNVVAHRQQKTPERGLWVHRESGSGGPNSGPTAALARDYTAISRIEAMVETPEGKSFSKAFARTSITFEVVIAERPALRREAVLAPVIVYPDIAYQPLTMR